MDADPKRALEGELAKLTILKLRELAHKHGVDISGTIRKKDIIDKLLSADIPLESARQMAATNRGAEDKVTESQIGEEERLGEGEIVEKLPEKEEITDQKIAEIREYIMSVMQNKPSFFPIDGEIEAIVAKYTAGDYYGVIQDVQKARQKASDIYAHFRIFTNAVGINASEKVLDEAMARGAISGDRKKGLVDGAMAGLVDNNASRREETLDRLEWGALSAYDKIVGDLGGDVQMFQKKAAELQELGANVVNALAAISEADRFRLSLQIDEAKLGLQKANDLLRQAEKIRAEELKYSIPRVRSMIEDARTIGIDVSESEKDLDKASYHLERGELKPCVEALSKAGSEADKTLNQRLASDTALREELLKRAKILVQDIGPFLSEAHSFGIDASEAYHYVSNAQIAINRQDPLIAMKFSRRASELSKLYSDDVRILKEKSVHVDQMRCGKCGQDMLYDYINGIRRCANCGWSMKK